MEHYVQNIVCLDQVSPKLHHITFFHSVWHLLHVPGWLVGTGSLTRHRPSSRGGSTRECRVRLSIMPTITPDLVEWLVSDPKVSSSWRSLAKHLSLSTYIPSLEVSRRNRKTDSQRMKELLIIWRSLKPATYNVETLLNMLDLMARNYVP